jgi:hypothetical protein
MCQCRCGCHSCWDMLVLLVLRHCSCPPSDVLRAQEAACTALEALAEAKPEAVRLEVAKVRDRFRNKAACDRVLAACMASRQRTPGAAQGPAPGTGLTAGSMQLDDS